MDGDEFHIRPYQETDQDAIRLLHHSALDQTGTNIQGDFFADLDNVESSYSHNGGAFLVGVLENEIVAMGGYVPIADGVAEIKRMRVHPGQQRQGLGRLLLKALEKHARQRGISRMELETTAAQPAAQALYESEGYGVVNRGQKLGFAIVRYERRLD